MNSQKIILSVIIGTFITVAHVFSDENIRSYIETSDEFKNILINDENNLTYLCSGKLTENLYYCTYCDSRFAKQGNNSEAVTFYTDGEKIEYFNSYKLNEVTNNTLKQQTHYLVNTKTTSFFADFDYDENIEVLSYYSTEDIYCGIYNLFVYQDFSSDLIEPYHASKINWTKNRINTIVNDFDYYVQFCIVQQKRGIIIKNYFYIGDTYTSQLQFYYWSPSAQRYLLDKSVTQDQLKNAYCPEDYFAYNGLKFSKLDSKLTEADLKDLDKAQLRLMRNAVYARHGRIFKSVDLQSLWDCYTWYKKNPAYSDNLLTETDKYNIELIQRFEKH
ncbi:MAG: YARHG domain-containing protein [Treponema sp.]|nr:YARHG domain-containing protein [Treponema sp.]